MILQLMKVKFSAYQAKYSPLITESLTTIFLPCQKASFVSKLQFVISNNYPIPKLSVDRIINLGYGEYLEGYENVLEF